MFSKFRCQEKAARALPISYITCPHTKTGSIQNGEINDTYYTNSSKIVMCCKLEIFMCSKFRCREKAACALSMSYIACSHTKTD